MGAFYAPGAGGVRLSCLAESGKGELRVLRDYRTAQRPDGGRAGEDAAGADAAGASRVSVQWAAMSAAESADDAGAERDSFGAGADGDEYRSFWFG